VSERRYGGPGGCGIYWPPGAEPDAEERPHREPQAPHPGSAPQTQASIREMGVPEMPRPRSNIHCLTIVGQIEGHLTLPPQNKTTRYEHVLPQLVALEQDPGVEGLLVILNTVGGDVEAGLAIAEMIAGLSKPTVSLVLGGGHSIGVPIAVAADYSFIAETASMTIHPIRLNGLVIGVPQTWEYLEKMQDRVVDFVVRHSRISEESFRDLMFRTGELARDIGTVLIGREAVERGIIDEVGGVAEAVAKLKELIGRAGPAPGPAGTPAAAPNGPALPNR